jgi:hypothetical protein
VSSAKPNSAESVVEPLEMLFAITVIKDYAHYSNPATRNDTTGLYVQECDERGGRKMKTVLVPLGYLREISRARDGLRTKREICEMSYFKSTGLTYDLLTDFWEDRVRFLEANVKRVTINRKRIGNP